MREKKSLYFVMSILPIGCVLLEPLVLWAESLVYGSVNLREWSIPQILLHWTFTCLLWFTGAYLSYLFAKKNGFNLFNYKGKPTAKAWTVVLAILCFSAAVSYLAWGMRFKPTAEFNNILGAFSQSEAIIIFIGQYIYYIFESLLICVTVVFGHKFGEIKFAAKNTQNVPWGGIFCGLTWGLVHIFSQDLVAGILSFFVSILFGVVYMLLKKNIRYAFPIILLMFIL